MLKKLSLLFCCAAAALTACGPSTPASTLTLPPSVTASPTGTPTPASTSTWTPTAALTPTFTPTSTLTTLPANIYPADLFSGWTTIHFDGFTFQVPPAFYIARPTSPRPFLDILNSKAAYTSWMQNDSAAFSGLLIDVISFGLDRRLDPYAETSPLVSVDEALQRVVNWAVGTASYVDGSTQVPWENANGGTSDGRKVFVTHVPYQNVRLGPLQAARAVGNEVTYYFILIPTDDSRYERIIVQSRDPAWLQVADQILSTLTYTP